MFPVHFFVYVVINCEKMFEIESISNLSSRDMRMLILEECIGRARNRVNCVFIKSEEAYNISQILNLLNTHNVLLVYTSQLRDEKEMRVMKPHKMN